MNIDWVTASCRSPDGIRRLQSKAEIWLHSELKLGNECVEWSAHGYAGLSCGSVQLGSRHDGILIRVTGVEAQHRVSEIMDHATNVSRIDFASTVALKPGAKYFAEACEREARRFKKTHNLVHQVELRRNTNTGNTVYLNRRVSDRFIRIYDKGAQSRLPELKDCWRAECQFNNGLAWSMARAAKRSEFDLAYIHNTVTSELEKKGVAWYHLIEGAPSVLIETGAKRGGFFRKLDWLRSQVGPSVQKLLDHGYEEEVFEALGLLNYVKEERNNVD